MGDAPEVPIAPLATIAATTNSNPKRPRSHSPPPDQHPDSNKRPRVSPAPTPVASSSNSSKPPQCIAPPPHPLLSSILALAATGDTSRGAGDVFLTDGWRARWCLCSSVRPVSSSRSPFPMSHHPSIIHFYRLLMTTSLLFIPHVNHSAAPPSPPARTCSRKKKPTSRPQTRTRAWGSRSWGCARCCACRASGRWRVCGRLMGCGESLVSLPCLALPCLLPPSIFVR